MNDTQKFPNGKLRFGAQGTLHFSRSFTGFVTPGTALECNEAQTTKYRHVQ